MKYAIPFACAVAVSLLAPLAATAATLFDIDAKVNASNTGTDFGDTTGFKSIDLTRGVYAITPVDRGGDTGFTALSVWNNNEGCIDGAGCSKGWFWSVNVVSETGGNLVPSRADEGKSSRALLTTQRYATPGAAFAEAAGNGPALFKLLTNDTVFFGITDTPINDNRGGVSFTLEKVGEVPLPLPAALLLGGVAMLGAVRSRRG